MEKKTIYIGGGVLLGVLILLLLVVWLLSVLTPHYYDYYEAEELISSKILVNYLVQMEDIHLIMKL